MAEPDVLLGQHLTVCESLWQCVCVCVQQECSILLGVSSSPFYPLHNEQILVVRSSFFGNNFAGIISYIFITSRNVSSLLWP